MKRLFFTVSLLVSSVLNAQTQEVVYVPQTEWDQAIEKLKSCKVMDVDLEENPTPYGFQCNDWMIYTDSMDAVNVSIMEIEGIRYTPE